MKSTSECTANRAIPASGTATEESRKVVIGLGATWQQLRAVPMMLGAVGLVMDPLTLPGTRRTQGRIPFLHGAP